MTAFATVVGISAAAVTPAAAAPTALVGLTRVSSGAACIDWHAEAVEVCARRQTYRHDVAATALAPTTSWVVDTATISARTRSGTTTWAVDPESVNIDQLGLTAVVRIIGGPCAADMTLIGDAVAGRTDHAVHPSVVFPGASVSVRGDRTATGKAAASCDGVPTRAPDEMYIFAWGGTTALTGVIL